MPAVLLVSSVLVTWLDKRERWHRKCAEVRASLPPR